MTNNIKEYDRLMVERLRLEHEKLYFGLTDREKEFEDKIVKVGYQLKRLSFEIKSDGKMLNDYELECKN
jgi:hypothetical protein